MFKVYKVTFPNKKVYIGVTYRDVEVRKVEHYRESESPKKYFHFALKIYKEGDVKCPIYNPYKGIICLNNNKTYSTAKDAQEDLDLKNSLSINRVCRGERTSYNGYYFEYIGGN